MRRGFAVVTVTKVHVETGGHFIEGEIEPLGEPVVARVATRRGFYWPIAVGEEWVVAFPDGEAATEPLALSPAWSTADPPPAEAVAEPTKVWVVAPDVHVKATTRAVVEAPIVELGATPLVAATNGAVLRRHRCAYTGGPHPEASAVVLAKE